MFVLLGVLCLLQTLSPVPAQLITLRDGKVGVNFGGYHADAGLGGLLTGNSAHGGLSASAGTPWGPRAAAGLGGNLDGRAAGVGYAAAQATPSVGASAVLGGSAGESGYIGAEAHRPGHTLISSSHHAAVPDYPADPVPASATSSPSATSHIQKVKPPKKYLLIKPTEKSEAKVVQAHKYKAVQHPQTVNNRFLAPQAQGPVGLALDIPIGILRSLQQSLGALTGGAVHAQAAGAHAQAQANLR